MQVLEIRMGKKHTKAAQELFFFFFSILCFWSVSTGGKEQRWICTLGIMAEPERKMLASTFCAWLKESNLFSRTFSYHMLILRCPLLSETAGKSQACRHSDAAAQSSSQCLCSVQSQKNRQTKLLAEAQNRQKNGKISKPRKQRSKQKGTAQTRPTGN